MPAKGDVADIAAGAAVAETPGRGAAEAADMPERVVGQVVEPAAVESLSSAGFDKPGQWSDYMTEPPQLAAGSLVPVSGLPGAEAESRLLVAEEKRIPPLPKAFSGDPHREQTSVLSAQGVLPW
jgi:hypothetical protein